MNREKLIKELKKEKISFLKVRFFKESPYQKNRYKPEYVGWEAWIYKENYPCGYVITQEAYENNKEIVLEGLKE